MGVWGLVTRELWHRRWQALLSCLGVTLAVAHFVVFLVTGDASEKETRRLVRDLGYNLRLIPADSDLADYHRLGFSSATMPQSHVDVLAGTKGLSYNHLLATLQGEVEVGGRTLLLTGISSEAAPPGKKKPSMIFAIKPGEVHVGYEAARALDLQRGNELTLAGSPFRVVAVLGEQGSRDDIRLHVCLADAQKILNLPDRINEIRALDCLCLDPSDDPVRQLRAELHELLPDVHILQLTAIATARARARRTQERYFELFVPLVLGLGLAWVGLLAFLNVRARTAELGTLKALGFSGASIGGLILARAALIGSIGAVAGFFIGNFAGLHFIPQLFPETARSATWQPALLAWALLLAPSGMVAAGLLPALWAVVRDVSPTVERGADG